MLEPVKHLTAIATAQCLLVKYNKLEVVVITPKIITKEFSKRNG